MTVSKILDTLLPYTEQEKRCWAKRQKKDYQRGKMKNAINDYKAGKRVNWSALKLNDNVILQLKNLLQCDATEA